MRTHLSKEKRGFTLIELLVVIAIIGILSAIVLASLGKARAKAEDTRRMSDMHAIQTALQLYANNHNGQYPDGNGSGCSGWETTGADGGNFIAALVADGDFPGVKDPAVALENSCGNYAYNRFPPGTSGCPGGSFYILGIRSTATVGTAPYPSSPGWSCPSRNWQSEFSWVTGNFE